MEVIIQKNADAAASLVSRIIAEELREDPHLVLGLATGRTMEGVYERLVAEHVQNGLDFSLCRTFNLDEYAGLPPEHPHSFTYFMESRLFSKVNIDKRNAHLPNGMAEDLQEECKRFEAGIADCGGIDVQLLGIGRDGHIGFNEPLSSLMSRTREKALTPETIRQNAELVGGEDNVPKRALTMGVGTILESRRCLVLVTGKEKAGILAKAVEGPITSMITASALQLHPWCAVITDEEAASELLYQDYYRWIFENEPEWQPFRE